MSLKVNLRLEVRSCTCGRVKFSRETQNTVADKIFVKRCVAFLKECEETSVDSFLKI